MGRTLYESRRAAAEVIARRIQAALEKGWLVFDENNRLIHDVVYHSNGHIICYSDGITCYIWCDGSSEDFTISDHNAFFENWFMVDPKYMKPVVKVKKTATD